MTVIFPKVQSYFDKTVSKIYLTQDGPNRVKFSKSDSLSGEEVEITEANFAEMYNLLNSFEEKLFSNLTVPDEATISFTISPIEVELTIDYTLQDSTVALLYSLLKNYQLEGTDITFRRYISDHPHMSTSFEPPEREASLFLESAAVGPRLLHIELRPEDAPTVYIGPPRHSTLSRIVEKRISRIQQNLGVQIPEYYLHFTGEITSTNQTLDINLDISIPDFNSIEGFPTFPIEP